MADDFVKPSLLPPPLATDLSMRALEAVQSRLSDIDLLPTLIYDFEHVIASALPHLGEQFHVTGAEGWRLAATEEQRRELLARAVALHRHKGTPWAIREALKAVGFNDLEIDERLPSNRYDGALTFSGSDVYAAYLVAAEIGGTDTLKELRMLFAAHGIGFIKLDVENPADSQVLIPARERDEIDWDMANRLATENRDFLEYVKLVKQFYQTGEARPADWDVPELDD